MDIFQNNVKATVTLSCEDFSLAVFLNARDQQTKQLYSFGHT